MDLEKKITILRIPYSKEYDFYCLSHFDEHSISGIDSTTKSMKIGAQQINNETAENTITVLFFCFKNGLPTSIVTISRDWSVHAYLPGSQRTHLSLS